MLYHQLFSPYSLGAITLQNRIVMAPMTRSRAIGHLANEWIATYYAQRASAGLIISESIAVSPSALGYTRMPALFNEAQTKSWKQVTSAVHRGGGSIFAQLMHVGRIAHPNNLPLGAETLAPSAIRSNGQIWTDTDGMLAFPVPKEMTASDIKETMQSFVDAAKNAVEAGFDGVELHGANGYLLEQFLSPFTNERLDEYGGTIEKRSRFILETIAAVGAAIGFNKVGIRLSPYSLVGDMQQYPEIDETYLYLAEKLDELGVTYIHLVDNTQNGLPSSLIRSMGKKFSQTIILAGNYTREKAAKALESGLGNLIAFGRPFINNPDLVTRFKNNWPLGENLNVTTFFSAGVEGYIDYPAYQDDAIAV
jgi:N-ethylmaleimide reductase